MDLEKVMREAVAPRPKVARPIVIIGSGGIVHDSHLPAYKKAGFPVAALVDVNREKAEGLAKDFGIPFAWPQPPGRPVRHLSPARPLRPRGSSG